MPKLIITQTPGLDGEYDAEFDIGALTNRELRTIKKISGVTAGKLGEALRDGDNDLLVAYAIVFLIRAGKDADMAEALLWDAPVGALQFDMDDDEEEEDGAAGVDARPPDSPTGSGNASELDDIEKPSEKSEPSGDDSSSTSDLPANVQSLTGFPRSGTGAT